MFSIVYLYILLTEPNLSAIPVLSRSDRVEIGVDCCRWEIADDPSSYGLGARDHSTCKLFSSFDRIIPDLVNFWTDILIVALMSD